jgi:transcriptional regulator with XRE-family HTH domain
MISSYVRRRRLASELIALRERRGMSGQELADAIGVARQRVSRLENGHVRPFLDEVIRILETLGVEGDEWTRLMNIARDAQEYGWWERHADEMGPRQALCANLEAGASEISEYQITLIPGLLQIPAYTSARIVADRDAHPPKFDPNRAMQARLARQQMLERPGGPRYQVVIDELAIRRPAAPAAVMVEQLRHIVEVAKSRTTVTVRVLPIAAVLPDNLIPRTAFGIYRYPDDPSVVLVDTITSDLIVADTAEADRYQKLYESLINAALTETDSLRLLARLADETPTTDVIGVHT